jgi:polyphosphate kinase 2
MNDKLSSKEYADLLAPLQVELNNLMHWLRHTGRRMVVLFEGRDTAGKGGVINTITGMLNPRQFRIVALTKPTEIERTQWYFQRYIGHLPSAGELVLFDRSWYNRAGVEKVMGFCTDAEYRRFLKETPRFEQQLVDEGVLLYKYWLAVDQKQQEKRFAERAGDPLKNWKLSPIDLEARKKYVEYGKARDRMMAATHTRHAPWTIVEFNDQKRGRLNLIRHLLDRVPNTRVPVATIRLPRLGRKPARERYGGPVRPIKGKY